MFELFEWAAADINRALQRGFAAEWSESLRLKGSQPLGEDESVRMLDEKKQPAV